MLVSSAPVVVALGMPERVVDGVLSGGVGARRFRPDIQGLRAVAVLLVVLYHARVPGLRGGYVGVDVFFVISGFLITAQLTREVTTSGRIRFAGFYARRVRRLLPSAALVVGATVVATRVWAPPLLAKATSTDALFTSFYGLNFRLSAQGIDYQQAGASPSPLQHYWSLAVEEQFYLIWPLLIMIVVLAGRRRWRWVLPVVLAVGAASSFLISNLLVKSNAPLAYFSIQSRAWELAVGGLVAVAVPRLMRLPALLVGVMATLGLVLVVGAGLRFSDSTAFPGVPALVPVLGAVLLIAAGCGGPTLIERALLRWRPVQGVGAVSYSWYLWHWPVLVLAPYVVGHRLGWIGDCGLMAGALFLAVGTYVLVERPVLRLNLVPSDWAGGGLLATLLTSTLAVVVGANAVTSIDANVVFNRPFVAPTTGLVDPFAGDLTSGQVTPAILNAAKDTPSYPLACIVAVQGTKSPECLIAPNGLSSSSPPGRARVVLIGDSHAGEFFDPIQSLAAANRWSVEVLNKVGCPLAAIQTVNSLLKRNYSECDAWRTDALQRLAREPRPQIIFVAQLNRYGVAGSALTEGWKSSLAALSKTGAPIVYLKDTPTPTQDIPTCLSGALAHWSTCSFKRSDALFPDLLSSSPFGLAATVDINPYLCPGTGPTCPAVRAGVLLYRDNSHVTRTAMLALAPLIGQQLVNAGVIPGTPHTLPTPTGADGPYPWPQ